MIVPGEGVTVVTPTYNERANLPRLVEGVFAALPGGRLVVVDDNSPDGTGQLAGELSLTHPGLRVIRRPGRTGFGDACREGFRVALEGGARGIVQMDADLSHDPGALPLLVAGLDTADVVIGSRYLAGGRVVNWPWRRLLLSRAANLYARLVTGLPVRDCTTGFTAYRREALERALEGSRGQGYIFLVELKHLAWRAGFTLREVPIVFTERTAGCSKMSAAIAREGVGKVLALRFRRLPGATAGQIRPPRGKA
jgi:dolichol-phosphate mannosyltransferase